MEPRQSQTNGERISSPPSEEKTRLQLEGLAGDSESRQYEATVPPALKAETGFSSYAACLEKNDFGYRELLAGSTGLRNNRENAKPQCAIIDLSMEETLPAKVSLRSTALSATQTLIALRKPPVGVRVQVVVLSVPDKYSLGLASEFASLLGLGLELGPRFFDAVHAQLDRHAKFEVPNNARFRSKYLLASGTVVAIARHFALANLDSPPVVLITGPPKIYDLIDEGALADILYDGQPKQNLVHGDFRLGGNNLDSEGARYYARLLSVFTKQTQDHTHTCNDLLLGCLLPLLQLDILRIRSFCFLVREYFVKLKPPEYNNDGQSITEDSAPCLRDDEAPDKLYRYRTILRSVIEQFEDEAEPLTDFISSQIEEKLTRSLAYERIEKARSRALKEACRLEAEIRDYLQVQAGHLSLLESRKSIELSNYQIQEGKRGQVLTFHD